MEVKDFKNLQDFYVKKGIGHHDIIKTDFIMDLAKELKNKINEEKEKPLKINYILEIIYNSLNLDKDYYFYKSFLDLQKDLVYDYEELKTIDIVKKNDNNFEIILEYNEFTEGFEYFYIMDYKDITEGFLKIWIKKFKLLGVFEGDI